MVCLIMEIIKNQNTDNKKYLLETIGVLRFPLMVCVILRHIIIPNKDNYYFVNAIDLFMIETFTLIAVPLFFFISGFLFFYGREEFGRNVYFDKLRKRVKRLLIPYLLWGVFVVGVKYIFYKIGWENSDYIFENKFIWIYYIIWRPLNIQLWFIRDLFLLVLISPLFYFLLKKLKFLFVLLIGIFWLCWHKNIFALLNIDYYMWNMNVFDVFGFDFGSVFFFSLGAWFALFNKDFTLEFKKLFPIVIVLYFIFIMSKFICEDVYFSEVFSRLAIVFGLISAVVIVCMLVKNGKARRNMFLEQGSLFIYYYHIFFLMYFCAFLKRLGIFEIKNSLVYTLVYIFIPIITILFGLWLYKIGMRYMPRVMNFVLGLK